MSFTIPEFDNKKLLKFFSVQQILPYFHGNQETPTIMGLGKKSLTALQYIQALQCIRDPLFLEQEMGKNLHYAEI